MAGTALTQALTSRSILGKRNVTIDPAVGWDYTNYNIGNIVLRWDATGRSFADVDKKPRDFFPAYLNKTLPAIYLAPTGNDSTGTGTEAAPYRSLNKAFQVVNAAGTPRLIRVLTGMYSRQVGGTSGMATALTVSGCVIEAYGGAVYVTTHDDLTWTSNATYAWVYQTTRGGASSAIWLDRFNSDGSGLNQEVRWVGSLAECSRNPGTMYTDGTTLYGYHPLGVAINNTNSRVFLNAPNIRMTGNTQLSILMTGQQSGDYFELHGGTNGGFAVSYTGGVGGAKAVVGLEQVRCRYHSNQATPTVQQNNITIEGVNGLFYAYNCDASASGNDNFGARNVLGADMSWLTVNCTGTDAGRFNSVSSNGLTWQEPSIKVVDIAGYYSKSRGGTCTGYSSAVAHLIGTVLEKSAGDRSSGGSFEPQELSMYDSTVCYGDFLSIRPYSASGSPIIAGGTAKIILRNTLPFSGSYRAGSNTAVVTIGYLK